MNGRRACAAVASLSSCVAACGFTSEVASGSHDIEVVATGIPMVDGIALHPDGSLIAVEERVGGAVRRVDLETGEHSVIAEGYNSADNVIVTPEGEIFFTQEVPSGRVMRIALDGSVAPFAEGLYKPEGLDRGLDGELYVAEHRPDGGVFRLDAEGAATRLARVQDGEGLRRLLDGSLVVAETSEDRLARIFPDGTVRRLARGSVTSPDGVGWDPDRSRLLVTEDEAPGRMVEIDPDRGTVVRVIATGMNAPQTMAFELDASILVAEQGEDRILRLRPKPEGAAP